MSVNRKRYGPQEKAKIALEALKGELTMNEITKKYGVHATQINAWKKQLKDNITDIFSGRKKQVDRDKDQYIEELHKQLGQLTIEVNWLKKNQICSIDKKRRMIDPEHPDISIRRQCELIEFNRSNYYYQAKNKISDEDIEIMNLIDRYYTKHPFTGTRKMKKYLNKQGYRINRKRVQHLYRDMGLEAIYPKPNLSKTHPGHKIYPYLLKGITINRTNQVWSTDITYLKLEKGYAYLTAIIDWHSRYVLNWTISSTLEADVCVDLLKETIVKYGTCEIFNTDQGSQFTSVAFTDVLKENDIRISMDGRGRALDNVFIERLWRSVKYECVYMRSLNSISAARSELRDYFNFYNNERFHQSLDYETPAAIYYGGLKKVA